MDDPVTTGMWDRPVAEVVAEIGRTFTVFDGRSQDSGHISYGVETADGRRWFVKTAGTSALSPSGSTHDERAEALRRAAAVQEEANHPALVPLAGVVEASDGVLVVHEWFDGELLRSPADRRDRPEEAHARFRELPLPELVNALDAVIDLHVALERKGWIAGDFYDGCLMYDFATKQVKVIDLECYRRGAHVNEVGRLPGSTRFMAPEEHTKGARIDARTTVYNLGRLLEIFVVDRNPTVAGLTARATADSPDERPPSVAALQRAWRSALG
jgi:hypothetical protein